MTQPASPTGATESAMRTRIAIRIEQLTPLAQLRMDMTPAEVDTACTHRAILDELIALLADDPQTVTPHRHHDRAAVGSPQTSTRASTSHRVDHR